MGERITREQVYAGFIIRFDTDKNRAIDVGEINDYAAFNLALDRYCSDLERKHPGDGDAAREFVWDAMSTQVLLNDIGHSLYRFGSQLNSFGERVDNYSVAVDNYSSGVTEIARRYSEYSRGVGRCQEFGKQAEHAFYGNPFIRLVFKLADFLSPPKPGS